jgi:hypothetical protein
MLQRINCFFPHSQNPLIKNPVPTVYITTARPGNLMGR